MGSKKRALIVLAADMYCLGKDFCAYHNLLKNSSTESTFLTAEPFTNCPPTSFKYGPPGPTRTTLPTPDSNFWITAATPLEAKETVKKWFRDNGKTSERILFVFLGHGDQDAISFGDVLFTYVELKPIMDAIACPFTFVNQACYSGVGLDLIAPGSVQRNRLLWSSAQNSLAFAVVVSAVLRIETKSKSDNSAPFSMVTIDKVLADISSSANSAVDSLASDESPPVYSAVDDKLIIEITPTLGEFNPFNWIDPSDASAKPSLQDQELYTLLLRMRRKTATASESLVWMKTLDWRVRLVERVAQWAKEVGLNIDIKRDDVVTTVANFRDTTSHYYEPREHLKPIQKAIYEITGKKFFYPKRAGVLSGPYSFPVAWVAAAFHETPNIEVGSLGKGEWLIFTDIDKEPVVVCNDKISSRLCITSDSPKLVS